MISEQKALSVYQKMADPLAFIEKMGMAIAKSGMFGCKNAESGQVLAMTCLSERKSPTEIARRYHIIDGKLSMKAGAMLADFKIRGNKYKVIERSPNRAAIEMTNEFQTQTFELTWEEAQLEPFVYGKAKQLKDNYATPRIRMQMLWARVVSDGVEVMAPEISYGVYTPEEISDYPELSNVSVTIADDGGAACLNGPATPEIVDAVFDQVDDETDPIAGVELQGVSFGSHIKSTLDEPAPKEVLDQIRGDLRLIVSAEPDFGEKFSAVMKNKFGGKTLPELSTIECVEIANALKKKVNQLVPS